MRSKYETNGFLNGFDLSKILADLFKTTGVVTEESQQSVLEQVREQEKQLSDAAKLARAGFWQSTDVPYDPKA